MSIWPGGEGGEKGRHIPAEIRRKVWERDGGQCTFVSDDGHRCEARAPLELDHIQAVARGGETSVGNIRLRCRAHNQYETERTFGQSFMREKRLEAHEKRGRENLRRLASPFEPASAPHADASTSARAPSGT